MNIAWIIILILLGFLLFGTSGPQAIEDPVVDIVTVPPQRVEVNGNPGVILDVETYSHDLEGWTPTEAQLQEAEDAVPAVGDDGVREPEMDGYRQYVGIIDDGERKIVINSMCDEIDDWENKFIMIADGGSCFWNALYNVDTGEMEYLIVNGEA
jgi:hypothetical protein